MKTKKQLQKRKDMPRHLWFGVIALLFGAGILAYTHAASAGTVDYSMVLKRSSPNNCPLLVNDSPAPGSVHIKQGDAINLMLTNAMSYPMSTPQVWIASQYNAHAGSAYSPVTTFSYGGSDSQHTGSAPWTASVGDVQQDLVVVTSFGIGETCLDGPPATVANIYVDPPESTSQSPSTNTAPKKKTTTPAQNGDTPTSATDDVTASSTMPVAISTATVNGKEADISEPFSIKQTESIVLSGTALPNATVTLTIHSTPKTVTVKADAEGKWSYTVKDLEPGSHYVEASVTDPTTGQTSTPKKILSFDVAKPVAGTTEIAQNNTRTRWLLAGLGGLALLAAAILLLSKHKLRIHLPGSK